MLFSCSKRLHIALGDGWGSVSQVCLLGWGLEGSEMAVPVEQSMGLKRVGSYVCVWNTHLCFCVSAITQVFKEKFQDR